MQCSADFSITGFDSHYCGGFGNGVRAVGAPIIAVLQPMMMLEMVQFLNYLINIFVLEADE